jgi:hypothetical protein
MNYHLPHDADNIVALSEKCIRAETNPPPKQRALVRDMTAGITNSPAPYREEWVEWFDPYWVPGIMRTMEEVLAGESES